MRPVCSVCNKKLFIFTSASPDGKYYCWNCHQKIRFQSSPQPIPIEYTGKRNHHITPHRISASELILDTLKSISKVHILFSTAKASGYTDYKFWGIDVASKKLVYITYDTDSDISSGILILPISANTLLKDISTFPDTVRSAFEGFTAETVGNYLSVCFPYDLTVAASLVMHTADNYAKVAYTSHAGIFFVQTDRQVFESWRYEKNADECIFTLDNLVPYAVKKYAADRHLTMSLELVTGRCMSHSTLTEAHQANYFSYSITDASFLNLYLPPEKAAEYFATFEKSFAKHIK